MHRNVHDCHGLICAKVLSTQFFRPRRCFECARLVFVQNERRSDGRQDLHVWDNAAFVRGEVFFALDTHEPEASKIFATDGARCVYRAPLASIAVSTPGAYWLFEFLYHVRLAARGARAASSRSVVHARLLRCVAAGTVQGKEAEGKGVGISV